MNLYINGESRAFPPLATVADLVTALELTGRRIALEKNGDIVPKSQYAQTPLAEGDRLEVVVAVGGG